MLFHRFDKYKYQNWVKSHVNCFEKSWNLSEILIETQCGSLIFFTTYFFFKFFIVRI